jgi:FixJ family two-component response regulator
MNPPNRVGVVDDDAGMRKALRRLLETAGHEVRCWPSALEFLADLARQPAPDCLVVDVDMPGMTGLELQQTLTANGRTIPIVFLTGVGNIPMTVQAIKAGAVNFLTKPVMDEDLFAAIRAALELVTWRKSARARFDLLTPREREVFIHVIAGTVNKQIASTLAISEQTVKVHRMRIMAKLEEHSVAGLVRTADRLGILPAPPK